MRRRRKPPCSVEGCSEREYAKGWCRAHYERERRSGDPRGAQRDRRLPVPSRWGGWEIRTRSGKLISFDVDVNGQDAFDRVSRHTWTPTRVYFNEATGTEVWYAATSTVRPGKKTYLHRFLGFEAFDHKSRNGLNCRASNMRDASPDENAANRRVANTWRGREKSSQYRGVSRTQDGRWRAVAGRAHLGYFETEEEAARMYDRQASVRWGEFAILNFGGDR